MWYTHAVYTYRWIRRASLTKSNVDTMHKILQMKGKEILLGNEAIVRGALESGVGFVAAYPGTPSSEIGDTFSEIAETAGIYFEWSANEKVAIEAVAGAAFAGVRSMSFFKHFGLNVASDSVFPLPYYGVENGMVIVVADDPQGWSSGQSEQDTRKMIQTGHMPYLEPSNPQECKDFVKVAFELSSKFKIPVFIRTTTRVNHVRGIVELGKMVRAKTRGFFKKGKEFRTMPPQIIGVHREQHQKLDELKRYSDRSNLHKIINKNIKSNVAIITSGVSYNYLLEIMEEHELKIPMLKVSMWPYPENVIAEFIRERTDVLVVEELEPTLENEVKRIAQENGIAVKIHGKDLLPAWGELRIEPITTALSKLININDFNVSNVRQPNTEKAFKVPDREAILCPGCPHRASFWAVKEALRSLGKDINNCVFGGDIGCYILGIFEPIKMQDFVVSMGAGTGIAHGISKVSDQNVVSFMGDSTFFHAGMPEIVNMVYNKANATVVVLDNRVTAMTGHQPHPGSGYTAMGEESKKISIADIAKACGANVTVVNPFSMHSTIESIKRAIAEKGVNVIVSDQECRLMFMRRARKQNIKVPVFQINQEKCKQCNKCIEYGCPAIHFEFENEKGKESKKRKRYYIDESFCWGCTVCAQICPYKAIEVVKEKNNKKND